jgi:16S rRNA (guanine527-N7)-methyltransferase
MNVTINTRDVCEGTASIGVELDEAQAASLLRYRDLLLEWNARFNLTAITDDASILVRHFIDSLSVLRVMGAGAVRVIDVGTGAGMPGIPLKIARPDLDVTLLDSTGKKIAFCEEAIRALGLTGIRAIKARAEEAAHLREHRERYDVVVARALAPLPTLVEYLLPFARTGGLCIAMKGSDAQQEAEQARRAIQVLGGALDRIEPVTLPGIPDARALVVIRKVKASPRLYPRQAGAPRSAPL